MNAPVQYSQKQHDAGVNLYNTPRQAGDLDLVGECRSLMQSVGMGVAVAAHYDTDPLVITAVPKRPVVQQHLLTRYLFNQFVALGVSTLEARSHLYHDIDPDQWLANFKDVILPRMLQFELPKQLPDGL